MAVTIVKRPHGYMLDSTAVNGQFYDQSGELNLTKASHGLSTGHFIYVDSNIAEYNGFWYIEVIGANGFYLREYATAARVKWIPTFSATCTYYKVLFTRGWNAVHSPIVYKLTNTAWPTNSIDTARTASTVVNNNGYCKITASGTIKTIPPDHLDYIKVSTGTLAGIYQILEVISGTVFTINLAYSADNDTALTGATIQYYYNNYSVRIKIWAGVTNWGQLKPFTAIAELDLKPDSNNLIVANINEYLKKQIKVVSNDLTLATLPNDIDSFTEFFIEYTETYDKSNYGDSMVTFVGPYTVDTPNPEIPLVAVNSKLQFKNRHSGYLSDYVPYNITSTLVDAKFLTLFEEPRYFIGSYYDISFLLPAGTGYYLQLDTYKNSVLQATSQNNFLSTGTGVYRIPISLPAGSLEDRIDVTIENADTVYSETKTINVDAECSFQDIYLTWKNYLGGMDYWKFTAQKDYVTDIEGTTETTENILPSWPNSYGEFSDTIDKETSRTSRDKIVVRSQNMSESEMNAVRYIVSSPLVQIMVSKNDRRTVKVSTGSFTWKRDEDKLYSIEFEIGYTNLIPSQSL